MEFYRNITTHTVHHVQTVTAQGVIYLFLLAMCIWKTVFFLGHLFLFKAAVPAIQWTRKHVSVSVSVDPKTPSGS